jgi:predicted dehydrogenase
MKALTIVTLSFLILIISGSGHPSPSEALPAEPVRLAVARLTHGHVSWILARPERGDIELVGIYEPDRELATRYAKRYQFSPALIYDNLEEMLEQTRPQGVSAFGSIKEHLEVVAACAPRGIHVMVEKPLAISLDHARQMEKLARENGIHIMTNYETTWYGSTQEAYRRVVEQKEIGEIRKIVAHHGHYGPKEIGVGAEFLSWLTDPDLNGGGAVIDFGCYGANLVTWLMGGARPESVTAVLQQLKPEIYPRVDDEATILLTYSGAQAVIQASWNWPFNRKDMDLYGDTGYIRALDDKRMRVRTIGEQESEIEADRPEKPMDDPFAYFAALITGGMEPEPGDLSSLEINLVVMEILDAARESARTGKRVILPQP